jgi:hypothetical protein
VKYLFFFLWIFLIGNSSAQENFRLMRWSGITSAGMALGNSFHSIVNTGYSKLPSTETESFYACVQYRPLFFKRLSIGFSYQQLYCKTISTNGFESFARLRGYVSRKIRYELSGSFGLANAQYFYSINNSNYAASSLQESSKQGFSRGGLCLYTGNHLLGYLYRTSFAMQQRNQSHTIRGAMNFSFHPFSKWRFTPGFLMELNKLNSMKTQFMLQSGLLIHYNAFHFGPLFKTGTNANETLGVRMGYVLPWGKVLTTAGIEKKQWQFDLDLCFIIRSVRECRSFGPINRDLLF